MATRLLLAVVATCLLLAGSAPAQLWHQRARVYVPFEFVVGETVLPAGTYSVMMQTGHSTSRLMLRDQKTGASVVASNTDIGMQARTYAENSNLVFMLDSSGRHVLHEIWLGGESHGHDLVHGPEVPEPK